MNVQRWLRSPHISRAYEENRQIKCRTDDRFSDSQPAEAIPWNAALSTFSSQLESIMLVTNLFFIDSNALALEAETAYQSARNSAHRKHSNSGHL